MSLSFDDKIPHRPDQWANDRLHFFKYLSFETAQIVLANQTLRWSTPRTLNDLYDVQFDLAMNIDLKKLEETAYERMWKIASGKHAPNGIVTPMGHLLRLVGQTVKYKSKEEFIRDFDGVIAESYSRMLATLPETQKALRENLEDTKVLCLTDDPTNPVMWAHYAQQNSGIVIRLRSIAALDSPYGMAQPMMYVNKLPHLMDEEHIANLLAGIANNDPKEIMNRMIYSKGSVWSYEREWRISAGDGRTKAAPYEDIPFGLNELDGVILGINMPIENRRKIIELTKQYPNVELMEAVRSSSGFHHDIKPLDS